VIAARAILADVPWSYRNYGGSTSGRRYAVNGAAAAHYDTMADEDIAAIPVSQWAADDAVLFFWATWPRLDAAFPIMKAWGFDEYVTAVPWVKTLGGDVFRGVGTWTMGASEVLLITRRGEPKPQHGERDKNIGLLTGDPRVFYAPVGAHSKKPEEVQDWIERLFPGGPWLELFARRERAGWCCWGGDLGFHLSAGGVRATPETKKPQQASAF
jgi:N6-adenosine-specific RNA methylase IME4